MSRWISASNKWPELFYLCMERINCDSAGCCVGCKACVGSLLNTLGDGQCWCPCCSGDQDLHAAHAPSSGIRGWIGWGPGQPELVGDNPAHSSNLEQDELSGAFQPKPFSILWWCKPQPHALAAQKIYSSWYGWLWIHLYYINGVQHNPFFSWTICC